MIEPSVTQKTAELVQEWIRKKTIAARERQAAELSEERLNNAAGELGAWLTPSDAKVGEKFNLWHGNGILQVMLEQEGAISRYCRVSWRKELTGKQLAEQGA